MNTKKIFLLAFSLVFLIGVFYSLLTPRTYLARSQVALFRFKIPDPDNDFEEGKNRWIWIRDGLNIKSALVTDEIIKAFIESNTDAKTITSMYPNYESAVNAFKNMISVQFTGADENNYIVEVKANSPKIAFELNKLLFMRLRFLAVDSLETDFNALISQLNEHLHELPQSSEEAIYYQSKIRKLTFRNMMEKAQRERSYEVITPPTASEIPIWPKYGPILVLTIFAGLLIGGIAAYTYEVTKGSRGHV